MAFVGYSVFDIHIQNVHSLKEKRFVLRSVKDRIAQKFNCRIGDRSPGQVAALRVIRGGGGRASRSSGRSKACARCWTASPSCESSPTRATSSGAHEMSHRTRRTQRVDELLKQEIARVIRDLKDPRIGFATVMDVRTSPDLRHARVYVSVLGTEDVKQTALALAGARGYVRVRVGEEITLKYLPELHFELDRTLLEQAARIDEIIAEEVDDGRRPVIDKPAGPTSYDVVDAVRRASVCVGWDTSARSIPSPAGCSSWASGPRPRLAPFCVAHLKTCRAIVRLGARSDTDDSRGVIQSARIEAVPDRRSVEAACTAQGVGSVLQVPRRIRRSTSTVAVPTRARVRGRPSRLEAVRVEVESIEIERYAWPDLEIVVRCGPGTYVRARSRGISARSSGRAACAKPCGDSRRKSVLGRGGSGLVVRGDAAALRDGVSPSWSAVADVPAVVFDGEDGRAFAQGKDGRLTDPGLAPGWVRVHGPGGFVGMGEIVGTVGLRLRPRRVLFPGGEEGVTVELPGSRRTTVTVGTFDGIHRGHQAVLAEIVARARAADRAAVLVTFDPHPLEIVAPDRAPALLTTADERRLLWPLFGLDYVHVVRVHRGRPQMPPEVFVREVLIGRLRVGELVIGYDHGFGKDRSGDVEVLRRLGAGFRRRRRRPGGSGLGGDLEQSRAARSGGSGLRYSGARAGRPYSALGRVERGAGRG